MKTGKRLLERVCNTSSTEIGNVPIEEGVNMLLDAGTHSISSITRAAVTAGAPATSCKMCQKKGLPILPVRYAAVAATRAHDIASVPLIAGGNFGAHVTDVAANKVKYTLRSLRYGFVYVFYPKTGKWQCYAVTNEGNVYDYPLDAVLDRSTEKPFSCTQTGHPELAQCITIENAEKAGTVYLAYSNVQWTKAVRDRYAKDVNSCRTKRMQAFNAAGWFASPGGKFPHAAKPAEVQNLVAEYKGGNSRAFIVNPFPYRDRHTETAALNAAMDHLAPGKGAIFALWDPVGITQELNVECRVASEYVMSQYEWGNWSASMLKGVKEAVEAGAVKDNEVAENMLEGQMMEAGSLGALFDGGKSLENNINAMRANAAASIPKVKEDAWEDYSTAASEHAANEYVAKMQQDIANEQTNTWAPLSRDHAGWLASKNLAHVFEYDFDENDVLSGFCYEWTFYDCIKGSTARREAFEQFVKWAQGKPDDHSNLALRALNLNLKVNVDHILAAGDFPYIELRETSAKAVESWFTAAGALEKAAPSLFAQLYTRGNRLIYELGAPLAKVIGESANTVAGKAAVLMVAARCGKKVIWRPVAGSQSQWITFFARETWEMMPAESRPSMKSLKSAIFKSFTTKGPDGRVTEVPMFIIVDKDGLANFDMPNAKSPVKAAQVVNPASRLVLTDEAIEGNFVPTFRKVAAGETASAGIGLIFTVVNTMIAVKEFRKATHFNSDEAGQKFVASVIASVGAMSNLAGRGLEAAHHAHVNLPASLASENTAKYLIVAGKGAAAAAGIVGAVWDFINAQSAWKEGHVYLALAYYTSSFLGAALVVSMFVTAMAPLVLPLTLLLIAVGIIVMWLKERELKEFLGRTFFGTNKKSDRFLSFAEEQKAYKGLGA